VLRAGRRWPCVLRHGLRAGPCRGRGVPASPQRGVCSSATRFARLPKMHSAVGVYSRTRDRSAVQVQSCPPEQRIGHAPELPQDRPEFAGAQMSQRRVPGSHRRQVCRTAHGNHAAQHAELHRAMRCRQGRRWPHSPRHAALSRASRPCPSAPPLPAGAPPRQPQPPLARSAPPPTRPVTPPSRPRPVRPRARAGHQDLQRLRVLRSEGGGIGQAAARSEPHN
jgi:hypothetical protein